MRHEQTGGAISAVVMQERPVTSVLLLAQTEALARRVTPVLEASLLEVAVATQPSLPSALRPRVVAVVAEELAGPWFSTVVDLLRTRGWGRRTLVVAPVSGENLAAVRKSRLSVLYPLAQLDGEFAKILARLAGGSSWEDRASARMQVLLGVTEGLCARFVEETFSCDPSGMAVGEVCRGRLFTSPSNLRSRARAQDLPGPPKRVLDRIVALRFAKLRRSGLTVAGACGELSLHRTTMRRLIRRVAGVTPGEVDEDRIWAAIEEWVDEARRMS